jgi:hypothetical protein
MPVTYPIALSAPRGPRRPGMPAPAPTGPTAAPTGPTGGPMAPLRRLLAPLPPAVRPLVPVALILGVGYLAFRLGNRR